MEACTHFRASQHSLLSYLCQGHAPSFSYSPILPTASLLWLWGFFLLLASSCLLSPFFCSQHCLFFILPFLFSPPPDFLYFYLLFILIPFPGRQAGGVSFQYHCFETNLLGFVMDNQMLAERGRSKSLTSLKCKKVEARRSVRNARKEVSGKPEFLLKEDRQYRDFLGFLYSLEKVKCMIFIFLLVARLQTNLFCWFLPHKPNKTHKIAEGGENTRVLKHIQTTKIIHFPFKCSISNRALNQWKV